MAIESLPSPEQLRQLLRYEPETGKLFWLPRGVDCFPSEGACKSWNTKYAGREAFTFISANGYPTGHLLGKARKAHRVIWAIVTGAWPTEFLDHINGVRSDNRFCNLREATMAENNRNRGPSRFNTSGYKGVRYDKKSNRWIAKIGYQNAPVYLGCFKTAEEAYDAYCEGSKRLYGEYGRI